MIGICDQSWLIDLLSSPALERAPSGPAIPDHGESVYAAYFGLGHHLKLHDRPGVFKVSLAGMALGSHLLKGLLPHELSGKSLDLGTGSGVLALLLRSLGAGDVTASDVSESAVDLAHLARPRRGGTRLYRGRDLRDPGLRQSPRHDHGGARGHRPDRVCGMSLPKTSGSSMGFAMRAWCACRRRCDVGSPTISRGLVGGLAKRVVSAIVYGVDESAIDVSTHRLPGFTAASDEKLSGPMQFLAQHTHVEGAFARAGVGGTPARE